MKNFTVYLLVLLVSLAYSYETIEYLSKVFNNDSITWVDDFGDDGKESESKKTDDKDGKKEFKEYLSFNKISTTPSLFQLAVWLKYNNLYNTSDYSLNVYSPPESWVI